MDEEILFFIHLTVCTDIVAKMYMTIEGNDKMCMSYVSTSPILIQMSHLPISLSCRRTKVSFQLVITNLY